MKAFLLFLFIVASHLAISQNRVVKDNLACLYGIKNPDGDWVVKPQYILLTGYTYGYFVIQEGPNYGLVAQDGTELLPCEYSKIKPLNYKWQPRGLGQAANHVSTDRAPILFQVEKNNMRGLVDSQGKTVIPLKRQYFRTDGSQNVIITEYREPNHFTSYIDLQGNYLFKGLPGAIEPFRSNEIALIGLRTPGSNGTVEGNVRVIDKNGAYIGSHQFDRALICAKGIVVFEDSLGHVGTMDASGRIIIPPRYKLMNQSYSRENILPCLYSSQHTFVIKNDEEKFGLMDGAGKVICSPQFDNLEKLLGQWKTSNTSWRVHLDGKVGMLNKSGGISIPCHYDTLIPFKLRYGRNTELDGFIVSDLGKFGLIKTTGDTIVPLEHSFFQHAPNWRSVLFGNPKQLFEITLVSDKLNIAPIEKLVELTDYSVFKGENDKCFILKEAENETLDIIHSSRFSNVISFHEIRKNVVIIDINGKRLDSGNVHSIDQKSRFMSARTSEGTSYLIDAYRAKRITEPSKTAEFRLQLSHADQVWSKGLLEPIDSWILLDTNGLRVNSQSFDRPFNLSADQVPLFDSGYWGIYSIIEKDWLLSPKYACINEITEEIFTAQLQNGKWELHSLNTKAVFGPFESLDFICGGIRVDRLGSRTATNLLFLVSNNGTSFLIDSEGKKITNPAEIKRIQTELAYGVYEVGQKMFSSRVMKITQKEPDFNVTALYAQLFDLVKELYPKSRKNTLASDVDSRSCRCKTDNNTRIKTELSYAKPNAASLTVSDYVPPREPWDVGYYEVRNYINVILVNGELKQIELLAIFGYNNKLLYNEFTRAITTDETLNLECSTVDNMIELVRNNFQFSDDGLVLMVEQNSRRSIKVTIPWERLAQLPTTKSFARIFMD